MKERLQRLKHILYRVKIKLLYTSSFGKTLRRLSWKEAGPDDGVKVIWEREQDAFAGHTMNRIADPVATERFQWEVNTWSRQTERVYEATGDITIEPELSLGYLPGRRFIRATRSGAHAHVVPSLLSALTGMGRKYTRYDTVIHFDGYAGRNLYHFFEDALNPLLMLLDLKLAPAGTPVLIHEQIYTIPYVQYMLSLPPFNGLTWLVQRKGEWVKVKKLFKAHGSTVQWQEVYRLLYANTPKNPHRKIFLNRKAAFQRRLLNNDEIEAIVREAGFEMVYAEDLSYPQQVALFAETSHLVAIHGAGVTNLLHSDLDRVHVLEIFSKDLLHPHFYWFLELLKIHYYDAIVGSAFDINWNFSIDAAQFRRQLEAMMAAGTEPTH